MPALTLNGFNIPLSVEGADSSPDIGEDAARTVSGTMVRSRLYLRRSISGTTAPLSDAYAADVVGILSAQMDHWSFDDATYWEYSEAGVGELSHTGASPSRTAAQSKFGGYSMLVAAGQTVTFGTYLSGAWTVMLWHRVLGTWHHYALTSKGALYRDGAVWAGPLPYFAVTSQQVVVGDTASVGSQYFDDMHVLQWACSADYVLAVYNFGQAVGAPTPVVGGDMVADWTGTRATCEPPDVPYLSHMGSGGWEAYGRTVDVSIAEV